MQNLREPPVDARVEGKVEALNTAIDRVNELEDVKAAAEAASRRAEAVIRADLDALYQQNKQALVGLAPFHEARQAAVEALARAKAADERPPQRSARSRWPRRRCRRWCRQVTLHLAARAPRASARSRRSLRATCTKAFGGGGGGSGGERRGSAERQVESHLRARLSAAVKRAGDARKAAKKARGRRPATRRLGRVGEALRARRERVAVSAHLESEAEYERQRAGLEAVRQAAEARLVAMEGEKARAVDMVGEAMESLEVLSNELHEAGQGGGGGGEGGSEAERPYADSTSAVETQHL